MTPTNFGQINVTPQPGQPLPTVGSIYTGMFVRVANETSIVLVQAQTPEEQAQVAAWWVARQPPIIGSWT